MLKILEREADSDDDDGGVEGTDAKFEAVRDVEAEVVAPLELVVFDGADGQPRAESAYVVKAEQVVRFEVRPANGDGESGTRDPREVGKKRDDRKRKDEKKKADERQTAERQARKAMRAKHAVGARVVLDPEIVQKYGSRDTLTEDCWGTITRIDGERARVAWDAGTPEARSGKTSFPLEVTAPRIIGRGATVLRAEIRDVAELGVKKAIEAGVDATQGALIRALDGPKDAFVKRWLEERGPLATRPVDRGPADLDAGRLGPVQDYRVGYGPRRQGRHRLASSEHRRVAAKTLALLERLGGRLRLSAVVGRIGSGERDARRHGPSGTRPRRARGQPREHVAVGRRRRSIGGHRRRRRRPCAGEESRALGQAVSNRPRRAAADDRVRPVAGRPRQAARGAAREEEGAADVASEAA